MSHRTVRRSTRPRTFSNGHLSHNKLASPSLHILGVDVAMTDAQHPELHTVTRNYLAMAWFLGGLLNAAGIMPSLFLLQIYDRVLSSRSVETLCMLAFVSILAYAFSLGIEISRSMLLNHAALHTGLTYRRLCGYRAASLIADGKSAALQTALNDVVIVEQYMAGRALIQLIDLPWAFVHLAIIYALNIWLGGVATFGMLVVTYASWWVQHRQRNRQ